MTLLDDKRTLRSAMLAWRGALAEDEVAEAVVLLGHPDGDAAHHVGEVQPPGGADAGRWR